MTAANGKTISLNPISSDGLKDLYTGNVSDYAGGIAILLSGCSPLARVIELEVNMCVEYVSTGNTANVVSMSSAGIYPATI